MEIYKGNIPTRPELPIGVVKNGNSAAVGAGKEFADGCQRIGDAASDDYKGHGGQNQCQPCNIAQGELFAKHRYADHYGGHRFHRAENGCGRRPDIGDGQGGAEKRYGCGEKRQCSGAQPLAPCGGYAHMACGKQVDAEHQQSEYEHVECHGERGHLRQLRMVYPYDIKRVR